MLCPISWKIHSSNDLGAISLRINPNQSNSFTNGLLALIIYYFGRQFLTSAGAITAGALYLYVTYINKIFDPIREIFANLNSLEDSFVASTRVFDLLDQEEDKYLGFNERPNFKGDIKFENVSFSYEEDSSKVLKIKDKVSIKMALPFLNWTL